MALTTFHFEATLPASADYLEPARELTRHMLAYCGLADHEAAAVALSVERAMGLGLPQTGTHGSVTLRFERQDTRLEILVAGAHLAAVAPALHGIDHVTVETRNGGHAYRLVRHVPAAE
jgi:hypothetical protein